ncbi:MAG TPA: AAA family ATPase [Streptosporangiaceae bacterium]|jgi:hypothetical protein
MSAAVPGPPSVPPPYAGVRETHAGVVFLVGDRAYKLKKPYDFGFLDYTTLEARRAACHDEVRLNRRLAPDVYLGVSDVRDPAGEVCDHLVVMRRMPDERRLAAMVADGAPVRGPLRDLARRLAAFHSAAHRGPRIDAEAEALALRGRWTDGFTQMRGFADSPVPSRRLDRIERLALRFLDGRGRLFAQRIADGRAVEGHGDLLADDVFCLDDGPRALDCLEFDARLRYLDGLDDAAFLAMDLERLGAAALADDFLVWYAEFAGDPAPPALRHHYVAYRAFVRAKVACLRYAQGAGAAAPLARHLAELAERHLQAGTVRLILVGGLPGTGKSTLSGALADRLGLVLLSSDAVRKELAGHAPAEPLAAGYRQGVYAPEWSDRTYTELMRRAAALLAMGESVVVDASWLSAAHRAAAARTADDAAADLVQLRCATDPAISAHRIRDRAAAPHASDADPEVARAMAADADPWPEAEPVDTRRRLSDAVAACLPVVLGGGAPETGGEMEGEP